jgi:hypothetical protein
LHGGGEDLAGGIEVFVEPEQNAHHQQAIGIADVGLGPGQSPLQEGVFRDVVVGTEQLVETGPLLGPPGLELQHHLEGAGRSPELTQSRQGHSEADPRPRQVGGRLGGLTVLSSRREKVGSLEVLISLQECPLGAQLLFRIGTLQE